MYQIIVTVIDTNTPDTVIEKGVHPCPSLDAALSTFHSLTHTLSGITYRTFTAFIIKNQKEDSRYPRVALTFMGAKASPAIQRLHASLIEKNNQIYDIVEVVASTREEAERQAFSIFNTKKKTHHVTST